MKEPKLQLGSDSNIRRYLKIHVVFATVCVGFVGYTAIH